LKASSLPYSLGLVLGRIIPVPAPNATKCAAQPPQRRTDPYALEESSPPRRAVRSPQCLARRPVACMGGRRHRVAPILVASSERRARSDQTLDCRHPAVLGREVQWCPLLPVYRLERRARTDEGLDGLGVAHRSRAVQSREPPHISLRVHRRPSGDEPKDRCHVATCQAGGHAS
jgi:hypothetical protein